MSYRNKFSVKILFQNSLRYNRTALQSAVENLNLIYGGQEQVISHVIYTNAGLDPWIGHGVSEYGLIESAAIYLQCEYLDDKNEFKILVRKGSQQLVCFYV